MYSIILLYTLCLHAYIQRIYRYTSLSLSLSLSLALFQGMQRYEKISNKSSFGIIDMADDSSSSDRIIVIVITCCLINSGAHECRSGLQTNAIVCASEWVRGSSNTQ